MQGELRSLSTAEQARLRLPLPLLAALPSSGAQQGNPAAATTDCQRTVQVLDHLRAKLADREFRSSLGKVPLTMVFGKLARTKAADAARLRDDPAVADLLSAVRERLLGFHMDAPSCSAFMRCCTRHGLVLPPPVRKRGAGEGRKNLRSSLWNHGGEILPLTAAPRRR